MASIDRIIWNKFHVKRGDNIPFCGWEAKRNLLPDLFCELNFNYGAEIGVRTGEFSELLCKKNPKLYLLCVDPWTPYSMRGNAETQENNYKITVDRLSKYNVKIIKKTSMDAVKEIENNSLDFVYIDGLHTFEPVMMDIIYWSHKVKRGGIVSGHDYCHGYKAGVVAAVDAFIKGYGIQNWYITNKDKEPSWLWVKNYE